MSSATGNHRILGGQKVNTYKVNYLGFLFVVDLTEEERKALEQDGATITEVKA